MTLRKRGLGRGLEALLADVPAKDERIASAVQADAGGGVMQEVVAEETPIQSLDSQADSKQLPMNPTNTPTVDDQAEMALRLINNIHRERMSLLEEAEILRKLISEFESIVRADLL